MTQADFARHIGVSRKSVTYMKQHKQIVVVDGKVDVDASVNLLRSMGRTFDDKNKLIKKNTLGSESASKDDRHLLNTEFEYPTLSQKNESLQQVYVEIEKEAEKEGLTLSKVLTDEINSLEPVEINKIKIFWQGQLEKLKYEKEIGKLVLREEVYEQYFSASRIVRDAVLGMGARVAHKLLNKSNIREIVTILDEETLKIMENLSNGK
jgi:DNA-binding XRE family transcriptional regulator